jgi:hypothetical protein
VSSSSGRLRDEPATTTPAQWPWGEIVGSALTDPFSALIVLLICLVVSAVESLQ